MSRRRAGLALVAVLALLAAGCNGDGGEESQRRTTTTTSSTTSSSTATSTTTTTTAPPVTVSCSSPSASSQTIYAAWVAGDRAAADRCAGSSVVETLFMNPGAGANWSFEGCGGPDPGVPQCFFRYEGGGVTLTFQGSEAAGWAATNISFVAD